jgi:hypothetical protein
MPKRQRLTNNSDETDIANLLSGDTVFAIPYFQRAYKWKPERLTQLNRDLLSLVDEENDYHFLGAIIIHGRRSNPSDPDVYDVIDGQQRITTLFLYLCAVVRVLCNEKQYQEASGIFLKYLAIGRQTSLPSNVKLHSCKDDRPQLNAVFEELLSDTEFRDSIKPFKLTQLLPAGSATEKGRLRNNYKSAVRFFQEQLNKEGIERVRRIYQCLLESISVVQIDVWDPTNGPKIFDSLNSRQEPMTTGDLIRNEIFSKIAGQNPLDIEQIDQAKWQPFYNKFKVGGHSHFDAYFFPYGLIRNPNLRKSEVYSHLRKLWDDVRDPTVIIEELQAFQDAFLDSVLGTNQQAHGKAVAAAFNRIYRCGAPGSTLPFLMQLSNAMRDNHVSETIGIEVLETVESFLVRRAICGHEPTGLHAVFKRLWQDCNSSPTKQNVTQAIKDHKTVVWPSSNEVAQSITERDLYGSGITKFLLVELNLHVGGDQPTAEPWIEHVLPTSPSPEWFTTFTEEEHSLLVNRIANLLPLSAQMNIALGNRPFDEKRGSYREDSAYKVTRQFGENTESWSPTSLGDRAKALAEWAVRRWAE